MILILIVFYHRTHRYNYDHVEVSGEESMEEFIKGSDSPETDSSSDDEEDTKVRVVVGKMTGKHTLRLEKL